MAFQSNGLRDAFEGQGEAGFMAWTYASFDPRAKRLHAGRIRRQAADDQCSRRSTTLRADRLAFLVCGRPEPALERPTSGGRSVLTLRSAALRPDTSSGLRSIGAHGPECPLRADRLAFLVCEHPAADRVDYAARRSPWAPRLRSSWSRYGKPDGCWAGNIGEVTDG